MKKLLLILTFFTLIYIDLHSQVPGVIYTPSSSVLGRSVMDPNGDGYVSSSNLGFSTIDYSTGSEMRMIALPVMEGEPLGDIVTGGSGGHTDIANFTRTGQSTGITGPNSVFVLKRTVNGVAYLVFRFRLGGASTATKGYSVLMDIDGNFGTIWNGNNPGFDREVVFETGTNGRVAIYRHENNNAGQLMASFNVTDHSQRSVAFSNAGGSTDYFYDYFIPLASLNAPGIVRMAAATITSAGSGITGTVSDFNGVDDKKYGNNQLLIMQELINIFPGVSLDDLDENFNAANWLMKSLAPTVNIGIITSSTSISGTSKEPNGTLITVFKNGVQIGTTTVTNGTWTLSGVSGLLAGDLITSRATANGKSISDISNTVIVTIPEPCFTPIPMGLTRTTGQTITGTYTHDKNATIVANTVRIRLYSQTNSGSSVVYSEINPSASVFVQTNGTWSFATAIANNNDFNTTSFLATATFNNCESRYSNVSQKTNGQVGTTTVAPTILTPVILASQTISRTVRVRNNDATPAILILYSNSLELARTSTTVASGDSTTFNYTGFIEGDSISARAQSSTLDYWLSNISNRVPVTTNVSAAAPVINGVYSAGTNRTVTGTSTELPGTTIFLYSNGTLVGTTTVDAFGNWSISGLTLTSGAQLTATAKVDGKNMSPLSNTVVVLPAPPNAPVITNLLVENFSQSITGTISGNTDSVVVFIDGIRLGRVTPSGGSWNLTGFALNELYKGANVYAVNYFQRSPSVSSNIVIVSGPNNFDIKDQNGNNIGTQFAGVPFNINIITKDNSNNTFTFYSGKNSLSSQANMTQGNGPTSSFSSGLLNNHTIVLTKAGTYTLSTLSIDNPTIMGNSNVFLIRPGSVNKLNIRTPITDTALYTQVFDRQPVVEITDAYGNLIDSSSYNSVTLTASIHSNNGNLLGTSTVNFNNGVATFTNLKVDSVGDFIVKFQPSNSLNPVYDTFMSRGYTWYGGTSTDFNTAINWLDNSVPIPGARIEFHPTPVNHCIMDQNRIIGDIKNGSNKYLDLNSYTLTLQGKLLFSNNAVIKGNVGTSKMTLKASSIQSIAKPTFVENTINYLQMENPAGVTLFGTNNELKIGNDLNFVVGKFDATGNGNLLTFLDNASYSGVDTLKFVMGVCKKIGNDAFIFPIGKGTKYAPCEISAPAQTTDAFTAEYFTSPHGTQSKKNQNATYGKSLVNISKKEHWEISRQGSSAVNISLYWYDAIGSSIKNTTDLTIAHFDNNSSEWEIPSTNSAIVPTATTFNSRSGKVTFPSVNTFSPFTFGETTNLVGLPVELKSFNAECQSDYVQVNWTTASEIRNKAFELYKSENAIEWTLIHTTEGQGDKATETDYSYKDMDKQSTYYRLKDLDFDGIENWSQIIFADCKSEVGDVKVYPNPATDYIKVITEIDEKTTLRILSVDGRILKTLPLISNQTLVDIKSLISGVYIIEIINQKSTITFKIIKI
jgi:hypothetical protein